MVLVLALIRFYMLGLLELSCEINIIANDQKQRVYLWTICFAYLFFGHLIDNIRQTKQLFVSLEFLSAFWFVVMGIGFLYDYKNQT